MSGTSKSKKWYKKNIFKLSILAITSSSDSIEKSKS